MYNKDRAEKFYKIYNNAEMTKLIRLLVQTDTPFELIAWDCGGQPTLQIASPDKEHCRVDAVSHKYSYGGIRGLIEVMGSVNPDFPNDDVVGYLTADEALKYFIKTSEVS